MEDEWVNGSHSLRKEALLLSGLMGEDYFKLNFRCKSSGIPLSLLCEWIITTLTPQWTYTMCTCFCHDWQTAMPVSNAIVSGCYWNSRGVMATCHKPKEKPEV